VAPGERLGYHKPTGRPVAMEAVRQTAWETDVRMLAQRSLAALIALTYLVACAPVAAPPRAATGAQATRYVSAISAARESCASIRTSEIGRANV